LIGVEPEVVKRPETDRIRVLISRKGFRAPGDRGWICSVNIPRRAAIALIIQRTIVCPAGLLWRSVKSDVTDVDSGSQGHAEGLNRPIQVLVIEGVFIVPDATT